MKKTIIRNPKTTAVLTALLVAGMATTPVMAEGSTYTPVTSDPINFDTTIYMKNTAKVPNITFKYAVAAGTAQAATAGNLAVLAGNDGVTSIGLPTIADIVFKANDAKANDGVSIKKQGTVDFSKVTYKEPGVYRYVVTETGEAQGVTNEDDDHNQEDRIKALDVYVTDNGNGKLVVSAYVMHNDESAKVAQLDTEKELDDKDTNFEHFLTTSDVTLSKKVTGNQGSRDEYFQFTVDIKGADAGTQFIVDLANADTKTKVNGVNKETHDNPALLTAGADGTLSQDFWIKNGQSIKIQGLGAKTGYTVTEADNAYKTNIAVTGDATNETENDIAAVAAKAVTDKAVLKDTKVAYTNEKAGAVPTGIVMPIAGATSIMLIGGAGVGYFILKNKKKEG